MVRTRPEGSTSTLSADSGGTCWLGMQPSMEQPLRSSTCSEGPSNGTHLPLISASCASQWTANFVHPLRYPLPCLSDSTQCLVSIAPHLASISSVRTGARRSCFSHLAVCPSSLPSVVCGAAQHCSATWQPCPSMVLLTVGV